MVVTEVSCCETTCKSNLQIKWRPGLQLPLFTQGNGPFLLAHHYQPSMTNHHLHQVPTGTGRNHAGHGFPRCQPLRSAWLYSQDLAGDLQAHQPPAMVITTNDPPAALPSWLTTKYHPAKYLLTKPGIQEMALSGKHQEPPGRLRGRFKSLSPKAEGTSTPQDVEGAAAVKKWGGLKR